MKTYKFQKILDRNRIFLLSIIVLFTLASVLFAFWKENIYSSHSSINTGKHTQSNVAKDIIDTVITSSASSTSTEIEILRSQTMIKKAMQQIDMKTHYYVHTLLGKKELYDKSPFSADLLSGEGIEFNIKPIGKNNYLLKAKGTDSKTLKDWEVEKLHIFGRVVESEYFMFTLHQNKHIPIDIKSQYSFKIHTNNRTVDMIQKNLFVDISSPTSSIINIVYKDNIALRSKDFNNVLVSAYLEYDILTRTEKLSRTLAFIDEQLSGINNDINNSRKNLHNFKKSTNLRSINDGSKVLQDRLQENKQNIDTIDKKQEKLKEIKHLISKGNIPTLEGENISFVGIENLMSKLRKLKSKKHQLRVDFTLLHPAVKSVIKEIKNTTKTLYSGIDNVIFKLEKERIAIEKSMTQYEKNLNELPVKEKIYGDLKHKFVVNEKIYAYFLEKRASTAIVKASTVHQSSAIDYASLPLDYISPNRTFIILIGLLIGIITSILLVLLKEYFDTNIKNEEDIIENTSFPLLANIPHIKDQTQSIIVFNAPKSLASEAFRSLRTNLQYLTQNSKESMVISITSTVGGEGKTTISSNLAGILSVAGKKVVLLNMDLRKPTLHTRFSLSNKIGISTLLSGNSTLHDVILPTKYDNVSIIASGPIPPNPSELIENKKINTVIEELKSMYDVIILDTPPVGLVTDARYLMDLSDVTLYVLRAKYSKKAFLDEIKQMHTKQKIRGLGLVLNGSKTYKDGYGYYEEGK